ncbi:hypothetical protein BMS3Abin02_01669 [bacterium BMS3Abin02]|nr:hypothetical protein BMS3Abin02_01669 [bacterium BMS3Abin02]HDL49657.1 hypothetical protein [Actinomycetota bacterium]
MRRRLQRLRSEHGAVLPLVGIMLVVLLGLSAFATDLGWFYLNANRAQRAADAAALAGVIYMPAEFATTASSTALQIAGANGFTDGVDGVVVTPSKVKDAGGVTDSPYELRVTVTATVPTFFLKVLGKSSQTITRSAVAEFVPPLPMGSPQSQFGNACDPRQSGCTNQPNFWANIHGKYTDTKMGDAYSSWCPDKSGSGKNCDTSPNPSWRDRGYLYGIEVASGTTSFTVNTLDLALHTPGGDPKRTGDHNVCGGCGGAGHTVTATLYVPDSTPLDVTDAIPVCTVTKGPEPELAAGAPYVWEPLCTVVNPVTGIYTLEIKVDTPNANDDTGLNRYSLNVTGIGATPHLYGIGDISIFNNISAISADFYLAEVDSAYRGKTFVVELYDPGDAQNNVSNIISFRGPPDGTIPWTSGCRISTRDEVTDDWSPLATIGSGSPCEIDATRPAHNYDGKWLKTEFDLPAGYPGGWWKVHYAYNGTAQDTTTWRAYIIGSPLHLVLGK